MKRMSAVIVIAILLAGIGLAVVMALLQKARADDVARMRQETAALAKVMRNAGAQHAPRANVKTR